MGTISQLLSDSPRPLACLFVCWQNLTNLLARSCLPLPRLLLVPLLVRPFACSSIRPQYDNRADDLTKEGMLKGIEEAAAFVLFLSSGVLERPYCQMEIRHAVKLKKPMILLHGEGETHTHTTG